MASVARRIVAGDVNLPKGKSFKFLFLTATGYTPVIVSLAHSCVRVSKECQRVQCGLSVTLPYSQSVVSMITN